MDPGERTTGTRDEHYDLISVLYHALQGAENCELYAVDAEVAGREDLAAFFREARETQTGLAERAKGLLGIGVVLEADSVSAETAPPETGVSPQEEAPMPDEGIAPPGEVPSDAPRTGSVPPRTGDAPPSPSEPPPLDEGPPRPGS